MVVDKLIPHYSRFLYGFTVFSIILSMVNFGMLAITLMAVKGIYIPLYYAIPIVVALILLCVLMGWFLETYKVWEKVNSNINQKNPQILALQKDVTEIKVLLEERLK